MSAYGQGFYDDERLFINKKNISKLNISSVTATGGYPDSSFHPLSNFVFEYKFDKEGNINKRKYWLTQLDGDKYLDIRLVIDTGYFIPEIQHFHYSIIAQSALVKFNQNKERTQQYISKVFNQFVLLPPEKNERCLVFGLDESNLFADTLLLNKEVHIPRFLLPYGDSVTLVKDTIVTFTKFEEVMRNPHKYYLTENNTIKIDWMLDEDTNKIWRSYYINSLGLLYKKTQNVYTQLYYYNSDNLHIRTAYELEDKTTRTYSEFSYR